MKAITGEWVAKAEGDYRSARREQRVQRDPNPDLVCFLSQQCAEKYLKGLLYELDIRFAKTHDLLALLNSGVAHEPWLRILRAGLEELNEYAVEFRYPGETATSAEAKTAFENCLVVRTEIRRRLGLDEPPAAQMKLQIKEPRTRYKVRRKRKQIRDGTGRE